MRFYSDGQGKALNCRPCPAPPSRLKPDRFLLKGAPQACPHFPLSFGLMLYWNEISFSGSFLYWKMLPAEYVQNGRCTEIAQQMAAYESGRITGLYMIVAATR